MKKMPDTVLIVDVESTCWERPNEQPPHQKNDIIEIGVVPLSLLNLTIGKAKNIIVKPTTSKVSKFCTRLTGLTQKEVDAGMSFKDACKKLVSESDTQKIPWVSWTDYEPKQFKWQCAAEKVAYPFGAGHWSFSDTFAKTMGLEHDVGLIAALKVMGMQFEGTHHRGRWDALNIAKLMVEYCRRLRGHYGKEVRKESASKEVEEK